MYATEYDSNACQEGFPQLTGGKRWQLKQNMFPELVHCIKSVLAFQTLAVAVLYLAIVPQITRGSFSWARTALGLCCLNLTSNADNLIVSLLEFRARLAYTKSLLRLQPQAS